MRFPLVFSGQPSGCASEKITWSLLFRCDDINVFCLFILIKLFLQLVLPGLNLLLVCLSTDFLNLIITIYFDFLELNLNFLLSSMMPTPCPCRRIDNGNMVLSFIKIYICKTILHGIYSVIAAIVEMLL